MNNAGNLKGALANAEIAARPEYIDDVAEVLKKIPETDIDILLKNGRIVEGKDSYRVATIIKGSPEASKFVDQITKLVRYQKQNGINTGVEVVSKQGFSEEAIRLLEQTKSKFEYLITWRVI